MKAKRALLWVLGLTYAAVVALAAGLINDTRRMGATLLQSCMHVDPQPQSWLCKQFFFRAHPTPEEVKELNGVAGVKFAFMADNERDTRRILKHYIDAGVDINAVDAQLDAMLKDRPPQKFTALHMAVYSAELMQVKLLLDFGASREIRDAKGRTPLELARERQAKDPTSARAQIIQLLEVRKPDAR